MRSNRLEEWSNAKDDTVKKGLSVKGHSLLLKRTETTRMK